MSEVTLDVKNFCVSYPGRDILTDVNFQLHRGEFVALIGANGAGKTTLLRAVLGLIPAQSGCVSINGFTPRHARSAIGYVPQKHLFQWDFPITVTGAVMNGKAKTLGWLRRPTREDWLQVFTALERAELLHLKDRIIGELSGGQKQRVLLARALASDPALLLLDEPFTGVDAPTQASLNRLYRQLAKEGMTILMSTHDMLAAREECSRVLGIRGGLALDSPTDTLTLESLHRFLHTHHERS